MLPAGSPRQRDGWLYLTTPAARTLEPVANHAANVGLELGVVAPNTNGANPASVQHFQHDTGCSSG